MHGWTFHGGRLSEAQRAYADAPKPWLDLSTGINPHAWPGAASIEVDWRALPDAGELAELERAAAGYFGTAPERVCALPGTEIGLRLLGGLGLPEPVRHVAPGYRTHGEAFAQSTAIDRHALADELAEGGTVLLANPNNPDGHLFAAKELVRRAEASSGWLIVDEAFADALPEVSVVPHLDADARVLVLRSFGKFFGLAGVRLGFAIGPEPMIAALRQKLGSWPVSSAAIRIGIGAYRDAGWIAAMRDRLVADAAAFDAVLARHGCDPIGECPLFRVIALRDGMALFDRLAQRGILTRPFDYAPTWLRLGLPGSDAALARLGQALADG
ncbi:threonine-phosphate decarboxylase [Sphingomonas sp. JC676]|uniref:threonine-phosphate decarboxylase n=1 Tax=Sphingomonas sp. JC676 TaxID=2768065 RepID=UPI00292A56A4|nr:threonine-phosphate decarboxylase [Sphingomonas sp. JC676]